jgi:hypothetical protein
VQLLVLGSVDLPKLLILDQTNFVSHAFHPIASTRYSVYKHFSATGCDEKSYFLQSVVAEIYL